MTFDRAKAMVFVREARNLLSSTTEESLLFRTSSRILADHLEEAVRLLEFIDAMAFATAQTAWGPLSELRQRCLWEIITAARGELPEWYRTEKGI